MKGFYVPPSVELLLVVVLTIAATQHLFLYLGLLLLAGLILPTARMGDALSYRGWSTVPYQKGLFIWILPVTFLVGTLSFYEIGSSMKELFSNRSILVLSSSPLKGVLLAFVVSKTFIFSFLRAKNSLKTASFDGCIAVVFGLMGTITTPVLLQNDSSNYFHSLLITFASSLVFLAVFGSVATVFSFLFSLGRR